jgi:hypothetical protein
VPLDGELLQDLGVRGIAGLGLPGRREAEMLEEHLAELLRRADVELAAAGVLEDRLLQLPDTLFDLLADLLQGAGVDRHPDALDLTENVGERQLHVVVEPRETHLLELRVQLRRERVDRSRTTRRVPDLGIFVIHRHLGQAPLVGQSVEIVAS